MKNYFQNTRMKIWNPIKIDPTSSKIEIDQEEIDLLFQWEISQNVIVSPGIDLFDPEHFINGSHLIIKAMKENSEHTFKTETRYVHFLQIIFEEGIFPQNIQIGVLVNYGWELLSFSSTLRQIDAASRLIIIDIIDGEMDGLSIESADYIIVNDFDKLSRYNKEFILQMQKKSDEENIPMIINH